MFAKLFILICIYWHCQGCYIDNPVINEKFCVAGGDKLYSADFDGDTYDDLLCFNKRDGKKTIKYSLSQPFGDPLWVSHKRWCLASSDYILVGDFNGDGRKDVLCHHKTSGYMSINYASEIGEFTGFSDFKNEIKFCFHGGSTLHIGDFNGDQRDDAMCSDTSGNVWIMYANSLGKFHGVGFYKKVTCAGRSMIADFNGDGWDDLICVHNYLKQIYVFEKNGMTKAFDNTRKQRWCGRGQFLRVADLNGDGYADFVCHNIRDSRYWVILNNPGYYFNEGKNSFDRRFCHVNHEERYLFGDYNGDGKQDMVCLNDANFQFSISNCS